jgi:hypothetical protein
MSNIQCPIDGDIKAKIGTVWIGSHGYPVYKKDSLVHRFVVESVLGRKLKAHEQVHHINGNKLDARRSNLLVCDSEYHHLMHARMRVLECGKNPNTHKWCSYHKCVHERSAFSTSLSMYDGLHNNCREATNQYRKEHGLNCDKFDWRARLQQQYRRIKTKYTEREICWLPKEGSPL